jgi:hypothetical protein
MNYRTAHLIGSAGTIYALDRDGNARAMTVEDLRQEAISFIMDDPAHESFMAQPFLNGYQTTRATAAVYARKYDATTAGRYPNLAAALESFYILTSPIQQNQARPVVYAACFDFTRSDWWIPAAEFPGSRR